MPKRERINSRVQLVHSGRDFGFVSGVDFDNQTDRYSRQQGQLYRLIRRDQNQHALFRVNDIGKNGEPTNPHIFAKPSDARDFIAAVLSKGQKPNGSARIPRGD